MIIPAVALAFLALQASPGPAPAKPEAAAVVQQQPSKPKQAPPKQTPKSPPSNSGGVGRSAPPAPKPPVASPQPRGTGEPKLKRRGN